MELEDRRDNLRLLALVARGLGFDDGLKDYVPPSERLAERLAEAGKPKAKDDGKVSRALEVTRFVAAAGGD